ncbi:hypothetical protein [Streptomyces sp. SID12501]|uniref:ATP-binding protein n=1 Tax=Streptomyces sp. SID12501 TaxID=2706042 RepID=A0A6B3C7E6_9ACTN|nr:hypothetical protein [Streptomyces sp. SID12501]NEC92733.1 hypothetical protein [Streptomyces sp. SID12501]
MKFTKVAAVVAGSVALLGAASPSFAAGTPAAMPPMSLTGGLSDALTAATGATENLPNEALAEQGDSLGKVVGTVQTVNNARNDLPGETLKLANGATQASPLLGGVDLNGGR